MKISDIKEGDTVVFRNGGREVVELYNGELLIPVFYISAWKKECDDYIQFSPDRQSGLDIVAIEPKPEPKKIELYVKPMYEQDALLPFETFEKAETFKDVWKLTFIEGQPPVFEEVKP